MALTQPRILLTILLFISLLLPHNRSYASSAIATGIASNVPATPEPIIGPTKVCASQLVRYSVGAVEGAISYSWTLPQSWTIVAGQGTKDLSVLVGSSGGSISVRAENHYGVSGSRSLEVIPAMPLSPSQQGRIEGPATLCAGSFVKYKIETIDGAEAYYWSFPSGWTIYSGQGTSEIDVRSAATGGMVRVTVANACGESMSVSLAVTVHSPVSNNQVQEKQALCAGQVPAALVGSIPTGGDGTYTYRWESSTRSETEGFVPAAGHNDQQHYTPVALTQTTWFRRTVASGDCQHTSEALQLLLLPEPAKPIIEWVKDKELKASVAAAGYEWRHNGVLLEQDTQTITAAEAGVYTVRVRNEAGCYSVSSEEFEIVQLEQEEEEEEDEEEAQPEEVIPPGVNMSLLPGQGQLILSSKEPLPRVLVLISNLQGREVYRREILELNKPIKLELGYLPDGVYVLLFQTPDLYLKKKILLQR